MDQYHPQHSGWHEFERHALEALVKTLEEALGPDVEVRHKSGMVFSSDSELVGRD
ncbi:hypothetical protein SAMN05444064_12625 [Pseudomonas syringae]|nr:hypothetical protein SAMN05444064_12625 [Pseudomonas syringae]